MKSLTDTFKKKNISNLSRLISRAENQDPQLPLILKDLFPKTGKAKTIGITGPPGAGKSSLVNLYLHWLRQKKEKVAVIAIDPVSPNTGGALLGDRIRLQEHFNDKDVFIRSLSTRGKLGGLSLATLQALHLCDAYGFDTILVETVGVGQNEVDVTQITDCSWLVLNPESGDSIQMLKAGIMEMVDLYVIHKSDRAGAETLKTTLENTLKFSNSKKPVLLTSIKDKKSTAALFKKNETILKELKSSRKKERLQKTSKLLLRSFLWQKTEQWLEQNPSSKNPYEVLLSFIDNSGNFFK